MRVIFLSMVLLLLLPSAFSQNSVPPKPTTANFSEKERWNLDKYVWSHTRYKTSNKDKPVIDFNAIDNWVGVGDNADVSISPDGKFFAYSVRHSYTGVRDSVIVQSTENNWKRAFAGATPGFFSGDSKQYIFLLKNDLYFFNTDDGKYRIVENVVDYKIPNVSKGMQNGVNNWLAYQSKNQSLVLINFITGKDKKFDSAANYTFDRSGKLFVCQLNNAQKQLFVFELESGKQSSINQVIGYSIAESGNALLAKAVEKDTVLVTTKLLYVSLQGERPTVVWTPTNANENLGAYSLDGSGKQAVFGVSAKNRSNSSNDNSIWYWKEGMGSAVEKVNDQTEGVDQGLHIQGSAFFTDNGKYIQFSLQPQVESFEQMPDAVQVDVWSYMDTVLQSAQPELLKKPLIYNSIFSLEKDKIVFEEKNNKKINRVVGDFAIIVKSGKSMFGDRFWEKGYDRDSCWIMSLKDRGIKLLPAKSPFDLSVKGNYTVCFDSETANYYSYNSETGRLVNMTAGLKPRQLEWRNLYLRSNEKLPAISRPLGWLDDNGFLVYDNYDIWQLDLEGKKLPVNITNGYGRSHQIQLQLSGPGFGSLRSFSTGDTLLLKAINRQNKYNGFYKKVLGKPGDPEKLYLGPYLFEGQFFGNRSLLGLSPLKAALANRWIVQRQTASESPDYFITSDFKEYKSLTEIQPQKQYNWFTTELHTFKQLDGTISQGILYKPENFDPQKKYPVIINFYDELTDQLNQFLTPAYIDMPSIYEKPAWTVSHGYLLFVPDIHFLHGQWGPSTVNTIDGAAKYLKTLPFVDGKHLGAAGHSNSGRFGYYLLTHSHSFSAMSIGSGFTGTDVISLGLSINKESGDNNLFIAERNALGAGGLGNLWKNKEKWIDHTAVLQADKATSPLLLFHCKNDGDDVRAAEELYIAFRRLEKPIWWLQYDEGGHEVHELRDRRDFTIRYTQFFDHYLKAAPMPIWMEKGIPNKLKGVESRYELEER